MAPKENWTSADLVGLGRLERPTSPLSGVRSNHLSYRPEASRKGRPRERIPTGSGTITHCPEKKEKRRRRRPAYGAMTGPYCSEEPRYDRPEWRLVKEHP